MRQYQEFLFLMKLINLYVTSKSGRPPLMALYPLNISWRGGVSFKQAAAIVARNGITFAISSIFELNNDGKIPIIKIRVIPNGSISALGISGKVSPFQTNWTDFLPALWNCSLKKNVFFF